MKSELFVNISAGGHGIHRPVGKKQKTDYGAEYRAKVCVINAKLLSNISFDSVLKEGYEYDAIM